MAKYNSLVPGVEIENVAEDFKNALKIEQYRLGRKALYFPAGLRWAYLPLSAIESVEGTHRSGWVPADEDVRQELEMKVQSVSAQSSTACRSCGSV